MYLEIDEGYWDHPKTIDLCGRLLDSRADTYPPRLWRWAVRSANTGKLGHMSDYAIERAVRYEAMDGKCAQALIASGFIDQAEDGTREIHDWMDFTGGAIKRMEDKAAGNKARRAEAKNKAEEERRRLEEERMRLESEKEQSRTGIVPESYRNRTSTNPSQTRQDKTSPDQSDLSLPRDPSSSGACTVAAPVKRPTGRDLLQWFGIERSDAFTGTLPWVTPRNADGDADTFAQKLPEPALGVIRETMAAFFRHVKAGDKGWDAAKNTTDASFAFGSWKSGFTALWEELKGVAPKPKEAEKQNKPKPATYARLA
jgi:hypothetical protein